MYLDRMWHHMFPLFRAHLSISRIIHYESLRVVERHSLPKHSYWFPCRFGSSMKGWEITCCITLELVVVELGQTFMALNPGASMQRTSSSTVLQDSNTSFGQLFQTMLFKTALSSVWSHEGLFLLSFQVGFYPVYQWMWVWGWAGSCPFMPRRPGTSCWILT